jgi:hypothetical protein
MRQSYSNPQSSPRRQQRLSMFRRLINAITGTALGRLKTYRGKDSFLPTSQSGRRGPTIPKRASATPSQENWFETPIVHYPKSKRIKPFF